MYGLDPRIEQLDDEAAQAWVVRALGAAAQGLYPVYREEDPNRPAGDLLIRLLSDFMRTRSIRLAERKLVGGNAPVFMYLFCYQSPVVEGRLKACHGLEVPFVFDMCSSAPITGDDPARFGLAGSMSQAWASFARCGDPGWPMYDTERRATMLFDVPCRVRDDPAGVQRNAWRGVHT
jgi:para-nitrobenzyl esterase